MEIKQLSRKQLKNKTYRDFEKGAILQVKKYRIHINGLDTYAEHNNNPMIALKEYDMPYYIETFVF